MLNDPFNLILLLTAAFLAGALNAVAGGGSFLTLPALVFTGIPSVLGNYLLPMQLGAGELRLPWLTRLSLRLQMAGTVLLVLSIMFGAVGAGWTFVTPMSLAAARARLQWVPTGVYQPPGVG